MIAVESRSNSNPADLRVNASKILANIPYMNGFHFYAAFGNYMEETASSLSEFAEVLRSIDEGSIRFHFPRGDFQKWIRETVGDAELAKRIDSIEKTEDIEKVRTLLVRAVQTRIAELEQLSLDQ